MYALGPNHSLKYFETSTRLLITSCVMLVASTFSVRYGSILSYWPVLMAVTTSFSIARSASWISWSGSC